MPKEGEGELRQAPDVAVWLRRLGGYGSADAAHHAGLRVLAGGIAYWVLPEAGGFGLWVEQGEERRARRLLPEEARRQRRVVREVVLPKGVRGLAWLVGLGLFCGALFVGQTVRGWPSAEEAGASGEQLGRGEWWRLLTAAVIHGDLPHLLGNLLGLGVFGAVLTQRLGGGWSLLLGVLGGTLGLAVSVGVRGAEVVSLGASGIVFALLGGVIGTGLVDRRGVASLVSPLVGGGVLVAWFGASAGNVDHATHLAGCAMGLVLGLLLGALPERYPSARSLQSTALWGGTCALVLPWALLLERAG